MSRRGPDFLIIGAQKSGTTWLWRMLAQHPDTDLRLTKELSFFNRAVEYERGLPYYLAHFVPLDPAKVTGEATATYFYDRVLDEQRLPVRSLPTIPELIMDSFPSVKILLILRDPVRRALSAYRHHMRHRRYPPSTSLRAAMDRYPHLRIRELGDYLPYLRLWQAHVPPEQFRIFLFESDLRARPQWMIEEAHRFLGLARTFRPLLPERQPNAAWNWTHIHLQHRLGPWYGTFYSRARRTRLGRLLDRLQWWQAPRPPSSTIRLLSTYYQRQQPELEARLGCELPWDYGRRLLAGEG